MPEDELKDKKTQKEEKESKTKTSSSESKEKKETKPSDESTEKKETKPSNESKTKPSSSESKKVDAKLSIPSAPDLPKSTLGSSQEAQNETTSKAESDTKNQEKTESNAELSIPSAPDLPKSALGSSQEAQNETTSKAESDTKNQEKAESNTELSIPSAPDLDNSALGLAQEAQNETTSKAESDTKSQEKTASDNDRTPEELAEHHKERIHKQYDKANKTLDDLASELDEYKDLVAYVEATPIRELAANPEEFKLINQKIKGFEERFKQTYRDFHQGDQYTTSAKYDSRLPKTTRDTIINDGEMKNKRGKVLEKRREISKEANVGFRISHKMSQVSNLINKNENRNDKSSAKSSPSSTSQPKSKANSPGKEDSLKYSEEIIERARLNRRLRRAKRQAERRQKALYQDLSTYTLPPQQHMAVMQFASAPTWSGYKELNSDNQIPSGIKKHFKPLLMLKSLISSISMKIKNLINKVTNKETSSDNFKFGRMSGDSHLTAQSVAKSDSMTDKLLDSISPPPALKSPEPQQEYSMSLMTRP